MPFISIYNDDQSLNMDALMNREIQGFKKQQLGYRIECLRQTGIDPEIKFV